MRFSILTLLIVTTICAVGTMSWNSSRPPSVAEWGFTVPPDGNHNMDEGCVYEHFYGKSWQEALGLLKENDEYYVEDFSYMPKPAFNFYYPVLVKHVTSNPLGERNVIGYLGLVAHKIEFDSNLLDRHANMTIDTIRFIEAHATDYDELDGPYHLFENRLRECVESEWFLKNGG